jgi:predicted secreted protein
VQPVPVQQDDRAVGHGRRRQRHHGRPLLKPSTGFAWDEPTIGDATVLRLADRTYQAPDSASLPIVGAAGGEVLTLHAVKAGTTDLSVTYSQPWAGGTKSEWTYRLSVTVQ